MTDPEKIRVLYVDGTRDTDRGVVSERSTYHDALAPFATTSAEENAEFLAWMDRGLARRARDRAARKSAGGTETGAPRAGEEGDRQ